MSIGYVTETTESQILELYKKQNPSNSSSKPFQGFIDYLTFHQKITESALLSLEALNKMHVTYDQIVNKINDIIKKAKSCPHTIVIDQKTSLVDKIFQLTVKQMDDQSLCQLCDHHETRVIYRITNTTTKHWFEFETINIHSLDKHHNFSSLGTDSHWQLFPTKICRILHLYHENVQDNIPKDPLIALTL